MSLLLQGAYGWNNFHVKTFSIIIKIKMEQKF
jgi:hypothetical protein